MNKNFLSMKNRHELISWLVNGAQNKDFDGLSALAVYKLSTDKFEFEFKRGVFDNICRIFEIKWEKPKETIKLSNSPNGLLARISDLESLIEDYKNELDKRVAKLEYKMVDIMHTVYDMHDEDE